MLSVYPLEHSGRLQLRAQAAAIIAQQAGGSLDLPAGLTEVDAVTLTVTGIQYLSRTSPADAETQVAASLALDQKYYPYLIDPVIITAEESVSAATHLVKADLQFVGGIVAAADKKNDRAHVLRALHILDALGKTNLAAQWLRRLTEHRDRLSGQWR